jgi:hypothetical protein
VEMIVGASYVGMVVESKLRELEKENVSSYGAFIGGELVLWGGGDRRSAGKPRACWNPSPPAEETWRVYYTAVS